METITVFLDGTELPNLRLFFKQIVADLQFPNHTTNIESFEDQINDLKWLEGAKVRISLSIAKDFLHEEDMQVRTAILQIMLSAMENEYAKSPILVIISKD
tara:strand:+ start:117 stop:419 length:303 start_codon:yes stop_codon:yes gene_type:complete